MLTLTAAAVFDQDYCMAHCPFLRAFEEAKRYEGGFFQSAPITKCCKSTYVSKRCRHTLTTHEMHTLRCGGSVGSSEYGRGL